MARCGRCGLWADYPEYYPEKVYAGTCLYYQTRLVPEEVFEHRVCVDYFERIPDLTPLQHFEYKAKRDHLGDAYRTAKRAKRLAYVSLVVSLASLISKMLW